MLVSIATFCLIFAVVVAARLVRGGGADPHERFPNYRLIPERERFNAQPDRNQILDAAVAEIERHIDGDDIRVTWVGATSAGWDDAVRVSCGESHNSILLRLGEMPDDIPEQMAIIVPVLREREAFRVAHAAAKEAAENSSFIWLYKTEALRG